MAGNWPDAPSRKMAYHNDGTVVAGRHPLDGSPYENFYEWAAGATGTEELNDLDFVAIDADGVADWNNGIFPVADFITNASILSRQVETVWLFPERRDLYGFVPTYHVAGTGIEEYGTYIEVSGNTTNGIDGDWVLMLEQNNSPLNNMIRSGHPEDWRTGITIYFFADARGVRVRGWGQAGSPTPIQWRSMFIFGVISAGETPDRILFVNDVTGLEFTKPMDWGDVPRGTTLDWDIYLLNNSSTLAANTMTLDFVTLYDDSDTWYTIKENPGGSFATTAAITSIAASARYPAADTFTVRLFVPNDAVLAIVEAILELSPAVSWT